MSEEERIAMEALDKSPHIPVSGAGSREESQESRQARYEAREKIVPPTEEILEALQANQSWKDDPETHNALRKLYRRLQAHDFDNPDYSGATPNFSSDRKPYTLDHQS